MEALKSPLLKPGDMGPAVKIWAWDYHPCSKHCVFVCQRLILLLMSHLYILSQHPPPCFCTQIHSVRSDSVERGLHVFMWIPSASHGLSGLQCVYIYLESSAWIQQNALRATRTFFKKREREGAINRIDSSLSRITLVFVVYQIIFCLKGGLFISRQSIFPLKY